MKIAGAEHMDFTDAPLVFPFARFAGLTGTIDTQRMLAVTNALVTAFFDRHLLGQPSDLLQGSSAKYPKLQIVARGAEQQQFDAAVVAATGSGLAAKLACSGVFVSGRKLHEVIREDIERLSPITKGVHYELDAAKRMISATLGASKSNALYRPGVGCTLLNDTDRETLLAQAEGISEPNLTPRPELWPAGDTVELNDLPRGVNPVALNAAVAWAFDDDTPSGNVDTRAIVVVFDGRIVAERYAPGYTRNTRFLGWSASKSVLGTLVGAMVDDAKLALDQPAPVPEWQQSGDARRAITIGDLMHMSSGLEFAEPYDPGSDSTTMLFRRGDMAGYAATKGLQHDPGIFWQYSSGTSNLLSRIVMQAAGGSLAAYHKYARTRLLEPAGMHSFVLEPDATGVFVGSSYAYATARDWARFGLLYLNRGVVNGQRILSEQCADYVRWPAPADSQSYFGAHVWLNVRPNPGAGERVYPSLPEDMYLAQGHNMQVVAIIPSYRAVIVRLGWTTGDAKFDVDKHFAAILQALHP